MLERLLIFGVLSLPVIFISWRTLFSIRHHGFYRFLSWECILWLAAANYRYWFKNPFSAIQIIAWIFLIISGYLILAGVIKMRREGHARAREEKQLYQFEQTTNLVDSGIFRYIRHPLYSSLLFLTWGILLKHITLELLIISLLSTLFLFLTAYFDEKECIRYFGEPYKSYMKKTRRFIPWLL